MKKEIQKLSNIHRKTAALESLFNKVVIAKFLRTAFFIEHLWWLILRMAASLFIALLVLD